MMTIRNSDYPLGDPFDTRSMGRQIVNRKQGKEKKGCGIFWFIGIFWLIVIGVLIWFFSSHTSSSWIWILAIVFGLIILLPLVKIFWELIAPKPFGKNELLADMENAQNGNVKAMVNVGLAYWRGDGVEKNLEEAENWLTRAAELGDPYAPKMLQMLSENPNKPF